MVDRKNGKKKGTGRGSRKKIGKVRIPEGHLAFVMGNGDVMALKRRMHKRRK